MPGRGKDSYRSPNQPNRSYNALAPGDTVKDSDLDGVTDVTIISADGSDTYTAEEVQIDRLKLRPRLGGTSLAAQLESADFRWALAELDEDAGESDDA